MQQFYLRYATANGLSVNDVEKQVNFWDVQQFRKAIIQLDEAASGSDKETRDYLKPREKVAKVEGLSNNQKLLLGSLITITALKATVRTDKYVRARLNQYIKDETEFQGLDRLAKQAVMGDVKDYVSNLSQSVWNGNDMLNGALNHLVSKKLAGQGISNDDLRSLFPYLNKKNIKPNTFTNYIHSAEYKGQQAIRWWSQREIDDITMQVFSKQHVTSIDIVNEPGACPLCQDIAAAGPYAIDDCPSLPIHNNCRCHKEAHQIKLFSL